MTIAASQAAPQSVIDVRSIAPRERHPLIFDTFRRLPTGGAMELVNDHDPKPLHFQFQVEQPGSFEWQYLASGPDTWRVRITRVAAAPSTGSCCGHCGGG